MPAQEFHLPLALKSQVTPGKVATLGGLVSLPCHTEILEGFCMFDPALSPNLVFSLGWLLWLPTHLHVPREEGGTSQAHVPISICEETSSPLLRS